MPNSLNPSRNALIGQTPIGKALSFATSENMSMAGLEMTPIAGELLNLKRLVGALRNPRKLNKEMSHQTFTSPFDGVSESFAQGIYESPGDLARLGEMLGEMSTGQRTTRPFSRYVDDLTQVNELGYTPENYGASPMVQALSRFGGNFIGDPLNAIPGGYIANKFGREVAGEVVDQSLKTGLRNQAGMVGYHGSPHHIKPNAEGVTKFDHSKMGSGEGAQAYGWGTYIAENPDVAKQYQFGVPRNGDSFTQAIKNGFSYEGNNYILSSEPSSPGMVKLIPKKNGAKINRDEFYDIVSEWSNSSESRHMYEVDLPDEKIAQMLDWDAPLSEQPPKAQKAGKKAISLLKKYYKENNPGKLREFNQDVSAGKIRGMGLYGMLKPVLGGEKQVSEFYKELGIPGIKYLDGGSRSAGQGTRNFVVFDENDMSILTRNGEKIAQPLPMDEDGFIKSIEGDDFINNPIVKTKTSGSSHSGSRYIEFETKDGDLLNIRIADHPQTSHALTLHGIPDIQIGDFNNADFAEINPELISYVKNKLGIQAQPLPMDEASRMQRARDMGFDLDVFRGSNFDSEELKGTVFLSSEPSVASDFAMFLRTYEGANVSPSKIKGKFLEIDADFSDIREAEKMAGKQFAGITDADYPNGLEIYDWAKANSYDGVKFKNAIDDPLGPNIPKASDVYAVFDPKNIRSKFAKFDPAKKNSANILAGGLLGAIGVNQAIPENRKKLIEAMR